MPSKKSKTIKYDVNKDFNIIGISYNKSAISLCHKLNECLNIQLRKNTISLNNTLCYSNLIETIDIYSHYNEISRTLFCLMNNYNEPIFIIENLKNINFLLLIKTPVIFDINETINSIKNINNILFSTHINNDTIKNTVLINIIIENINNQ